VLGRASDLLVDTEKVGKDIDGGSVGVGRNDEMVLETLKLEPRD